MTVIFYNKTQAQKVVDTFDKDGVSEVTTYQEADTVVISGNAGGSQSVALNEDNPTNKG